MLVVGCVLNQAARAIPKHPAKSGLRPVSHHTHIPKTTASDQVVESLLSHLTVATEGQVLSSLPVTAGTGSDDLVGLVSALAKTASGTSGRGKSAELAVLVHRVDDPLDARVVADSLVLGINENDLEVLVGIILLLERQVEKARETRSERRRLCRCTRLYSRGGYGEKSASQTL